MRLQHTSGHILEGVRLHTTKTYWTIQLTKPYHAPPVHISPHITLLVPRHCFKKLPPNKKEKKHA